MNLEDYRVVFSAVGLIGVLLFTSPALSLVVHLPGPEKFSELYILGPGHMASDYPLDVSADESYMVYLGVGDHLGSSAYYGVIAKFRNQSEPLPNSTSGVASPLESLYEYRAFLEDGKSWEAPLTFSFLDVRFSENQSLIEGMMINGVEFNVDKAASWDVNGTGYYYQIFFELWLYDAKADLMQFHNRFVDLWLNMTVPV
jgi:hypothetical protein